MLRICQFELLTTLPSLAYDDEFVAAVSPCVNALPTLRSAIPPEPPIDDMPRSNLNMIAVGAGLAKSVVRENHVSSLDVRDIRRKLVSEFWLDGAVPPDETVMTFHCPEFGALRLMYELSDVELWKFWLKYEVAHAGAKPVTASATQTMANIVHLRPPRASSRFNERVMRDSWGLEHRPQGATKWRQVGAHSTRWMEDAQETC